MSDNDYESLTCTIPDCAAALHLDWDMGRPLFQGDSKPGADVPALDDAYVGTWKVSCEEGHVILVPGPAMCPCGDDECAHTDFDASDELRTFRRHDLDRLLASLPAFAR